MKFKVYIGKDKNRKYPGIKCWRFEWYSETVDVDYCRTHNCYSSPKVKLRDEICISIFPWPFFVLHFKIELLPPRDEVLTQISENMWGYKRFKLYGKEWRECDEAWEPIKLKQLKPEGFA